MKNTIVVTGMLLCIIQSGLKAQLNDAQWVLNDNASVVDFRIMDTVWLSTINTSFYTDLTNASICDNQGDLLYFTNGLSIANINDTLPNGSGLSPCTYSSQSTCCGLNIPQAAIFISSCSKCCEAQLGTANEKFEASDFKTLRANDKTMFRGHSFPMLAHACRVCQFSAAHRCSSVL